MIDKENLDIRTITMGISLKDCANPSVDIACKNIYKKIIKKAENLVSVGCDIEKQYVENILPKKMYYNLGAIKSFSLIKEVIIMFRTMFAICKKN